LDAKEALGKLRTEVGQIQASGQQFIATTALLQYLAALERNAPAATEFLRAKHETWLAMFNSVIETGKAALTSVILVNGGAAVALLAYLGGMTADDRGKGALVLAMVYFAFGVLGGAVASDTTYLSQLCYAGQSWYRWGVGFHILSVLVVLASYVLFACGILGAYRAFT
jgi:hypothetical protein